MTVFRKKKYVRKFLAAFPHSLSYPIFKWLFRRKYKNNLSLRYNEIRKNEYSFRGFDLTKSIFIHIPKAAGISINNAIYGCLGGGHRTIFEYRLIYSKKELNDYYKFAIVRNPWDRLVSAYFFLKDGGYNNSDKEWFDANLSKYTSFEEFVLKWLNTNNIYSWNHFIPQSDYVIYQSKLYVDQIIKLEELENKLKILETNLAKKINLPHNNKSTNRNLNYRDYYTEETRKIVETVYQNDVSNFGYSF